MAGLTTFIKVVLFAVTAVNLCSGDIRVLFSPDPPEGVTASPASQVQLLVDKVTDRLKCVQHGLQQLNCVQCLKTERILKLLGINGTSSIISSRNAQDLSFLFLHHILNFRSLCSAFPPGCSDFSACQWHLMSTIRNSGILESLENILRQVKQVMEPDATKTCFTAESILEELNITSGTTIPSESDAKRAVTNMMGHIFEGHCINVGESVTDFLDDLFHVYGEKCSSVISVNGLKKMMEAMQNKVSHDHGDHDHSHDHHQDKDDHTHCDHHHDHNHLDHDHSQDHGHRDHDHSSHDHDHSSHDHDHHNHDHDHHEQDHDNDLSTQSSRVKRSGPVIEVHESTSTGQYPESSAEPGSSSSESTTKSSTELKIDQVPPVKNGSSMEVVLNSEGTPASSLKSDLSHQEKGAESLNKIHYHTEDLRRFYLKKFGGLRKEGTTPSSNPDDETHEHISLATKCLPVEELISKFGHSANSTLSKAEFLQVCPALVQQVVSGVCNKPLVPAKRPSDYELYGYSSLSVLVITLTSLAGVFLLPILTKSVYHYVMNGFIGLAFSTLAGDAFLHLIPQALGIHSHDDSVPHAHDHSGGVLESVEPYVWKQLGLLAAIYFLFLFEAITCVFNKDKDDDHSHGSKGHGHSHVPDNLPKELTLVSVRTKSESSTQLAFSRHQSESSLDTEIAEIEDMKKPEPILSSNPVFLGLTSVALVVTLGDSFHNFGDGLAIGAAFSSGLRGGLSTSIAVFCHELPHEFGDFVILLSTGLSFSKALLINFISGLTCFAGLYIGIQLGDNVVARQWIMAVTAGIFLYVALAEMLPELKEHQKGRPSTMLIVKNLGVLAGIAIMLVISIYEERFYI